MVVDDQRRNLAYDLGVEDKARRIVETKGVNYHVPGEHISADGLWGDFYTGEYGQRFETDTLSVEVFGRLTENRNVRISRRQVTPRKFWFPKVTSTPVYFQQGEELCLFKDEKSWLGEFNDLYSGIEKR